MVRLLGTSTLFILSSSVCTSEELVVLPEASESALDVTPDPDPDPVDLVDPVDWREACTEAVLMPEYSMNATWALPLFELLCCIPHTWPKAQITG